MFQSFKRWLGAPQPMPINPDPFGREARKSAQQPALQEAPTLILEREEILDARTRIAGYRFSTALSGAADVVNAKLAYEALAAGNLAAFAERRLALIPVLAQNWFRFDHRALVGPHSVFMLDPVPEQSEALERWHEVVRAIRDAGAKVALTGVDVGLEANPLFDKVNMLVLDFAGYSLDNFEMTMARVKRNHPALEIIVEGMASWPERRLCVARGAAFCLGPFTTTMDGESQPGEVSQGRLVLIEMLNLLRRDADLAEITELAKRHPEIAVKIVSMANSPMQGLTKPVASIDQAIMILGRQQLYRWLSIGMYRTGVDSPRDEVLLELALARGRFLELIGSAHFDKLKCEEMFLVGLLSLLDSMLGMPMAKVLERLRLSDEMRDVLLHSEGPLGRYLMLVMAVERGINDAIARLGQQLDLSEDAIRTARDDAFEWTNSAMQSGV